MAKYENLPIYLRAMELLVCIEQTVRKITVTNLKRSLVGGVEEIQGRSSTVQHETAGAQTPPLST